MSFYYVRELLTVLTGRWSCYVLFAFDDGLMPSSSSETELTEDLSYFLFTSFFCFLICLIVSILASGCPKPYMSVEFISKGSSSTNVPILTTNLLVQCIKSVSFLTEVQYVPAKLTTGPEICN